MIDGVVEYDVVFEGELPQEIETSIQEHSKLFKLKDKGIHSYRSLAVRAKKDIEIMQKILKNYGYFNAKIKASLKKYPLVQIKFDLKNRFKIKKITASKACFTKIKSGDDVDAQKILDEVSALKNQFEEKGYPFVVVCEPEICIDEKTIDVHFPISTGAKAKFGEVSIVGLKTLSKSFVTNRLFWKKDDLYNPQKIKKTRRFLLGTGLFSSVDLKKKNQNKLYIKVKEAAPRALGASIRYSRFLGIESGFSFKNYNVFKNGESFSVFVKNGKYNNTASISYEIPDFFGPRELINYELSAVKENLKSYKNKGMSFEILSKIPKQEILSLSLKAERSLCFDHISHYSASLLIPNIDLEAGREDDYSAPEKGIIAGLNVTPHIGFVKKDNESKIGGFYKVGFRAMTYVPVHKQIKMCNFLKLTAIPHKKLDSILPTKRLFAGGVDSVRAYGFKMLGPLDAKGNPKGWVKKIEYGLEIRYTYTEKIDIVAFFEGACLTQNLMGPGMGVRYKSDFGIIRADIATPLKRRFVFNAVNKKNDPVDSLFQFYVGIGQTF